MRMSSLFPEMQTENALSSKWFPHYSYTSDFNFMIIVIERKI